MYEIYFANLKAEKILNQYLKTRRDIKDKLIRLKQNPRKNSSAHALHGRLSEKWSCWLGINIRMIYSINEDKKIIFVEAIGTHKVY